MRRILRFIALGLVFFLPSAVYAAGNRQIITETADGIDIWQKEFNVSRLKPGTYNIIVHARDSAGNEGISGPFNVKVDPIAGLPETSIVYPRNGQVIRGDITVIGVAQARYGLKQLFFKIDDEEYKPIEGFEYWNLRIPAEDLDEGLHTLHVKASDSNDLEGPEFKMSFILDYIPPAFELIDREIGDLIAGTVKVKGKVTDMNGIKALELSTDGGETYKKISTSGGKRHDPARYFQFSIPSKKHEDGPLVYFLRATNTTGYSETKPILFFVNNYPPQIDILSPETGENSWGKTQVTGRVISGVGLTEFYYEWAGERGDIPLRPGDPFWSVVFPISMANNRAVPFRVTAVDKSGNTTVVTQRFQDTRRFRVPTLIIDYPRPPTGLGRMTLAPDQPIYGHIADGFFPEFIVIDGEIEYVNAQPSFRIDPWKLDQVNTPIGNSTMRLWAQDEEGATGNPVNLRINRTAPPSGFQITESAITIDEPEYYDDFGDYHIPWAGTSITFRGYVDDYRPGYNMEYRMNWSDSWRPVNLTARGNFDITVSLIDEEEGAVPIEFRTVRNGVADIPLFSPVNRWVTRPVIRYMTPDRRWGPVQRSTTAAGMIDYYVPLRSVSYSLDGGNEFVDIEFTAKAGRAWFNNYTDFTALNNERQTLIVRAVDRAGNSVEASPDFVFDNTDAFPKIILNAPRDGDLVTGDFEINGLAYVDVGIYAVYWRILTPQNPWDTVEITRANRHYDVEFERLETQQNYLVPLNLDDVRDGENILEIFAEDIYGVQGEITTRVFHVSTAAPELAVKEPAMNTWTRKNLTVKGTAYDNNGIDEMLYSMDNGVSWQRTDFVSSRNVETQWVVNLNTEAYSDGIYSMLVRTIDHYGIESYSAAIVNIDNTPPTIDIGTPHNGDKVGVRLPITGQVYDNLGLEKVSIQFMNISNPNLVLEYDLPDRFVVMESLDVSAFPDDDYTLKVSAIDRSGNESTVIRNVTLIKARAASEIAIINPMPGIAHAGPVTISGTITGAVVPDTVTLMMDKRPFGSVKVDRYGIFTYEMPHNRTWMGESVVFSASFMTPDGDRIESYDHTVKLFEYGPIVVVDSHEDGDVITKRPYISGRAFIAGPDDVTVSASQARKARAVDKVELSFDNGRTFIRTRGTDQWRYRLETSEIPAGSLPIMVRATFKNGSIAVRRILLTVDTRPPIVHTIGPTENTSHRTSILVYGSAEDDHEMDTIEVSLRPGDKIGYSVPGFIQGLYLEGSFLGGLDWATGLGLTFFDDNVKVQAVAAQAPSGRYSGWAFGGKILANIYNQNLSKWFGLDWEFGRTSLVLGAQFLYFMMEDGETPVIMSELLGQWEIIKADMSYLFPKWKYFKSLSIYVEPGLWFAPSDVGAEVDPNAWRTKFTIGFGGRISLF